MGVSEASVRRWSDEGALPVRRVGKRRERRFAARDVDRFNAARRNPSRPPRHRRDDPAPHPARPQVVIGGTPVEVSTHLAAFYGSDTGRLRLTVPFLAQGLKAGQPCYLIADGDVLRAYLEALEHSVGFDALEAARAGGRLLVAPGPGATRDEALEFWEQALWNAVDAGAQVIRVVGEMTSARAHFVSEREMLAFESAVDQTLKRFPCVAICQYDARQFSGEAMLSAFRAHPDIYKLPLGLFLN